MKRTTIDVELGNAFWPERRKERYEVKGYLCDIGIPAVVHRKVEKDDETGEPVLCAKWWTVSEPQTGARITSELTRKAAIERATRMVGEVGIERTLQIIAEYDPN